MSHLGRRELIGLLGGLAAWPLPLGAQPLALPVVGVLLGGSPEADAFRVEAFRQGLKETGYVEGQNVVIEYRFAENDYARLPGLAADLVQRQVTVIAAIGNAASRAAKQATTTVPIVFEIGTDPVEFGMVGSLARPGGNLTGVTFLGGSLAPKQFEVLHEPCPRPPSSPCWKIRPIPMPAPSGARCRRLPMRWDETDRRHRSGRARHRTGFRARG